MPSLPRRPGNDAVERRPSRVVRAPLEARRRLVSAGRHRPLGATGRRESGSPGAERPIRPSCAACCIGRAGHRTNRLSRCPASPFPLFPASTGLPTSVLSNSFGLMASGWPVAYLLAAVILGVGLMVGSLVRVSHSDRVAVAPQPMSPSVASPTSEIVGRVTGMVDCVWEERGQQSVIGGRQLRSTFHSPSSTMRSCCSRRPFCSSRRPSRNHL